MLPDLFHWRVSAAVQNILCKPRDTSLGPGHPSDDEPQIRNFSISGLAGQKPGGQAGPELGGAAAGGGDDGLEVGEGGGKVAV